MKRQRPGFSLLELVVVIGAIGIVSGIAVPVYRDYQIRNDLAIATEQVTQGLARARTLAQAGQEDDGWGFYIPSGTLYKGTSYESRDTVYDEVYPMPSTIATTGLTEVAYSQMEGLPNATGSVILTALNSDRSMVLVTVEQQSVAVINPDQFTICHFPPGNPENAHTITISDSAWPGHRDNHGDTLGPCEGDATAGGGGSSSAGSVVAVSSSSVSSVAGVCEERFSVASDGTITTTGDLDVTFTALGSDITFGEGGPEIAVTVERKNPDKKNKWIDVFNGNDIDGGEVDTATYQDGDQVIVRVRGYYRQSRWLSFDEEYGSNDRTGHVVVLRDGDTPPDYPAFDDQGSLKAYLADILDANGRIDIGTYDAVLLVELGDLESSAADFQDGVVLLTFGEPSCS